MQTVNYHLELPGIFEFTYAVFRGGLVD